MRLAGRVAIITGGGTGIGKGISRALAAEGARVAIAQRQLSTAEEACRELQAAGLEGMPVCADIRDRVQVQEMVARTVERWGAVDVLVNNAAVTGARAVTPFLDCPDELLDEIVDVNLKGAFICSQEVARRMVGRGGAIINISSVGAFAAQEGAVAYCASKAGLVGLTKAMALDLAPHAIRVNCVAPGDILTEASRNVQGEMTQQGVSGKYFREIPLGRRGTPEEIGKTVLFLASDDSSYITGETIIVDGGFLNY
jgi:NAD(P)-dependent dehydrogenase (short-subunit alcohol dehydrogenase family)